jgi:tetratricopeptide (TPR) repeat protein
MTAVEASSDPLAKLATERVAGRVMAAAGRPAEAREHFERALELAVALESPADTSRIAFEYAQFLEAGGDAGQAMNLYRQAYRARQAGLA